MTLKELIEFLQLAKTEYGGSPVVQVEVEDNSDPYNRRQFTLPIDSVTAASVLDSTNLSVSALPEAQVVIRVRKER